MPAYRKMFTKGDNQSLQKQKRIKGFLSMRTKQSKVMILEIKRDCMPPLTPTPPAIYRHRMMHGVLSGPTVQFI